MLKITKNNVSFTTSADAKLVVATKLIDGKGYRMFHSIDGTFSSFAMIVNRLANMSNDDYKLFSNIQMEELFKENEDDL